MSLFHFSFLGQRILHCCQWIIDTSHIVAYWISRRWTEFRRWCSQCHRWTWHSIDSRTAKVQQFHEVNQFSPLHSFFDSLAVEILFRNWSVSSWTTSNCQSTEVHWSIWAKAQFAFIGSATLVSLGMNCMLRMKTAAIFTENCWALVLNLVYKMPDIEHSMLWTWKRVSLLPANEQRTE